MTVSDSTMFVPVELRRGFEAIYEQVREAVSKGELKPGDRLPPERDMAQIFGVSRPVVREGLRALQASGIIQLKTGSTGGAFIQAGNPNVVTRAIYDVASLGGLTAESLLEARILITADVIRIACKRATEADLELLEADITKLEQADAIIVRTEQRSQEITEFYRLLALATHNEVLVAFTDALANIVRVRLNRVAPRPKKDTLEVRRRILAHIRKNEPDQAIAKMSDHLERLERYLNKHEAA